MQFKRLLFTITFLLNLLPATFAQEPTLLEHGGGVWTVEFSPVNASLVATAGENNLIKLWNLKNNTARTLRGHTGIVRAVAFSPNGNLLASVSDDGTIKLWNVRTQQNIATLREGTLFVTVAFSPDGQLLATGGDEHVKLWDVRRRVVIATFQYDKWVGTVAFSHDGQFLAVGDEKEGSGTVKVWDVESRQVVATLEEDLVVVRSVTFSPDDRYLASSHYNGEVKVWNVSDWELLRTIQRAGDYDIAFSPDGRMIAGTGDASVNLWWVEDGTKVAELPGPTGWKHPVDFSHDGTSLAVGGEDGIVRLWRINTSFGDNDNGGIQILHTDTYFQQLPEANSVNGDDIPDPAPPAAVVRAFFDLDPFYEQWINVEGLPVIASAKVNPYALKETAWVILKMIGHRPDVLRAMVLKKVRFAVIGHTELLAEIPAYNHIRDDFVAYRVRGSGGTGVPELLGRPTTTASEEGILAYRGENTRFRDPSGDIIVYNALIHEFAHAIHLFGLNTLDPTFEERLQIAYEAAMKKGLWRGTYASSDIREYWAESSLAWFYPKGSGSFDRFGNTQEALKEYDPDLAILLTEVYGDTQWRYTLPETRTHLPHLQGFNLQGTPIYQGFPELEVLYEKFMDPNSDGGDDWVDLKPYDPSELANLKKSRTPGARMVVYFFNLTQTDVFVYVGHADGFEQLWTRVPPNFIRGWDVGRTGDLYVIKDTDGRNLVGFQAEGKLGRAMIGTPSKKTNPVPQEIVRGDVNKDSKINVADLRIVMNALGKKAEAEPSADIDEDGNINVDDLLLVIEHLDDPVNAAAPALGDIKSTIPVSQLQAHLKVLHAESDGSSKYWRAIAFLEYLITAARPNQTVLLANYPNPFNPETWIPYQLSEPTEVTLHIYAVDGALVRALALGHQPAGIYHSRARAVYWDGKNEAGEAVASGIYFYTLSTGNFTATRKMLILK